MALRASNHLIHAKTSQLSWQSGWLLALLHLFAFMFLWLLTQKSPFFLFLHSQLLPTLKWRWNAILKDKQAGCSFEAIAGIVAYVFTAKRCEECCTWKKWLLKNFMLLEAILEFTEHTNYWVQSHQDEWKAGQLQPPSVSITWHKIRYIFSKPLFFVHSDAVLYNLQWQVFRISCSLYLSQWLTFIVQMMKM